MKITELANLVELIANDKDDLTVRENDEQNFQSGRNNLKGQIFASGHSEFVFNQEISLTTSVNIINNFQKVKEVPFSEQIYAAILYGIDTPKGKKPNFFSDAYASAMFGYNIYDIKNAGDVISFEMDDNPGELISKIQLDITAMEGNDFQKNVTINQNKSSAHAYSVTIPSKMYYQYIASKIQEYVNDTDVSNIKEAITNNVHTAASNVASNDLTVVAYDSSDIKFNASQISKSDVELTVGDDQSSKRSATMNVNEEDEGDSTSNLLTSIETEGEVDQNSTSDQKSDQNSTSTQSTAIIVTESKTLKNVLILLVVIFLVCLFFGCLYTIKNNKAKVSLSQQQSSSTSQ